MRLRRNAARCGLLLVLAAPLASVSAAAGEPVPAEQLYAARCAFCHGEEGAGDGLAGEALEPRPTNFARREFWQERTPEQVRAAIQNGKPGTAMVPFGGVLSAEEIDALAAYLCRFAAP